MCSVCAAFSSLFDYLNKATHTEVNTTENLWTHRYTVRILFNLSLIHSLCFFYYHFFLLSFLFLFFPSFFLPLTISWIRLSIDVFHFTKCVYIEILVLLRDLVCLMIFLCFHVNATAARAYCNAFIYEHCKHAQRHCIYGCNVHKNIQLWKAACAHSSWLDDLFLISFHFFFAPHSNIQHQLTGKFKRIW